MVNDEPPKPGNLTQERLVTRASNAAADLLAQITNEMFAVKNGGDWSKVIRLLGQLAALDGDAQMAGAILGMISPWLPNLRDVPKGTPRSVRAIQMAIKGLDDILPEGDDYRWPTLEDSIKWLVDEKVAGRDALQSLHRDLRRRAFSENIQGSQKLLDKLQSALAESLTAGDSVSEFRQRISDVTTVSASEAETILRTNTKQAYLYGQERTLDQPGVRDRFRWVYYAATKDSRARAHHSALDGWVAERGSELHRVMLRVQSEYNCLLPGNTIAGDVQAAVRSRYKGKAVEIVTQSGAKVRVTENHPVLTKDGWVRAGAIKQGDQLLRHVVHAEVGWSGLASLDFLPRTADVDDAPAVVEEVFSAFSRAGVPERRRSVVGDFHGDGEFIHGDVEVVRSHGQLLSAGESVGSNQVGNLILEPPLSRLVSMADLQRSLAVGHSPPFDSLRIGLTTGLDSAILQSRDDDGAGDSEAIGERLDGLSRLERSDNLVHGQFEPPATGLHPESSHPFADGLRLASKLLGNLVDSQPRFVGCDQVTSASVFEYVGHVYDFQTATGVIVSSGGVLLSNCRCTLIPCDEKRAEEFGIKTADDLPAVVRRAA